MSKSGLLLVHSNPLNHLISLPPAYTPEAGPWPVLCFLHGLMEAAPMAIHQALTLHGPLRPGNPPLATDRFIVVAPQLPAPGGDVWFRYANAVQRIVRKLQERYHGDPRRTYLTGFSFGGNGVLDLALAQPDFWPPSGQSILPVYPQSRRARSGCLSVSSTHGRAILSLAWNCCERNPTRRGSSLYRQRADHTDSATTAYCDDRIYGWLLTKQLLPDNTCYLSCKAATLPSYG